MPSALVFYQYFHPDDVVSAVLLTELAEGLVNRGWSVTAMPCNRSRRTNESYPKRDTYRGVVIERIHRPPFPQDTSLGRIINCLWMLVAWSLQSLFKSPDVLIIGTDPILSATTAIPWKLLRPSTQTVHWCFDLYPEAAIAGGILKPGLALRSIRRLMRSAYRRLDFVADIGDCMRARLAAYSTKATAGRMWPWALKEPAAVAAVDPGQRQSLFGGAKLAIMYSGSFGRAHSLSETLKIARGLRDVPAHFSFGIRGNGVAQIRQAVTSADHNISFAPFVPEDQLEARLSAADIHIVSLRPEWTGAVVPSKFFGALAAGRPVLFIGSEDCCIAKLIRQHGLGWVCTPGEESKVVLQLRQLIDDPASLHSLKSRCHRIYQENFSRPTVLDTFDAELRNLLSYPSQSAAKAAGA